MVIRDGMEAHLRAARIIASGGTIAFRTDTFYGLGVDPFNPDAVSRIKELKGRDDGKPILVVISDKSVVDRFSSELSHAFKSLSSKYWPGPLTLVVRAKAELPEELTAGTGTIGIRLPDDEKVRTLVDACGGALTATSANLSGTPPASNANEVLEAFSDKLDLIIDGGQTLSTKPSSVVDVSGNGVVLIREGVIPWKDIERVL
jgi:L-threonylcarbamoyladenylate synthase